MYYVFQYSSPPHSFVEEGGLFALTMLIQNFQKKTSLKTKKLSSNSGLKNMKCKPPVITVHGASMLKSGA